MNNSDTSKTELIFVKTRYDEDAAERLKRTTKLVEQDKKNLLNKAKDYEKKYEKEIDEGTRKRQLLLAAAGNPNDPEEQAKVLESYGKFLPTKYTPILNLLYFMLQEERGPDWLALKQEFSQRFGGFHEDNGLSREDLESKYGGLMHEDEKYDEVREPEELDRFIYGSCTHDTFKKIKKLKALSKSSNENEAFLAYRMCLQLCKRYGLEFDKIPCSID